MDNVDCLWITFVLSDIKHCSKCRSHFVLSDIKHRSGIVHIIFQNYQARIDALQKQVEEQSMTMSMYSSYTTDDFAPRDEDIFG